MDRLNQPRADESVITPDASTAFTLATLWQEYGAPVFVLTPNPESARRLSDQLSVWCGDSAPVFQFAEHEGIPFERYVPDLAGTHQRLRALSALRGEWAERVASSHRWPIVVASVQAASQATLELRAFESATHMIALRQRHKIDQLTRQWIDMGYVSEPTVEIPGTFSRRGGILDVFPVSSEHPFRIEFFDDEVESIRRFDVSTQRSLGRVKSATITPAHETLPKLADRERVETLLGSMDLAGTTPDVQRRVPSELARLLQGEFLDEISFYAGFFNFGTVFDYLSAESLVISLRPSAIEDAARSVDDRMAGLRANKEKRGEIPHGFAQPHVEWGFLADKMNAKARSLNVSPWGVDSEVQGGVDRLPFESVTVPHDSLEQVSEDLKRRSSAGERIVILSNHALRIKEVASEARVAAEVHEDLPESPEPGEICLINGSMRQGFSIVTGDNLTLTLLTDAEVFGVSKERRRIRKRPMRQGPALEQLKPGSYVVHIEHGIARFAGTQVMGEDGREFLVLEYAEDDKLYVPTEQLDRIQLYHGAGDTAPKLTRLGTQEWSRAKARAQRATEQLAGELIALYASRSVAEGISAGEDTPWQDQLESSFPYEETDDQLRTIEEVKKDLESTHPMDRLVCGDVGYGKTEVALRAAFKVAQSGRQVAILVPTTVLAQQHLTTFTERLQPFPVSIEMLSRFRSDAEQKDVVEKLARGEVDIVIGTHRLLQRDVRFKNLGLVIIDEEHKFGVAHKERLKRMRTQVDVLTLSATPIPRTLHMALAGVRDMSTIETPPEERLPIKTYVSEESEDLLRESILRELDREGQVFVLHNRVKDIDLFAAKIKKLVPEAEVGIGHGQMVEDQLEDVMAAFEKQEFNVLVCTTIIESGIDLPNVNTLIVDRADMFGLSQLYQIRGRIGRGTNRAYSYLLIPRGKQLTEQAEQRLNTILAATELGAGFQIAMRDLEIRGMGNILGGEQSGHISAIGFDLYTKLLADAVRELKEGAGDGNLPEQPDFSTVRVDLGVDARIPEAYVEDLAQRLSIYQRLARVHEVEEIDDLREELKARFGPVPRNVELLFAATKIRVLAETAGIDSVAAAQSTATLTLREPTGGAREPLQKALGRGVNVGHMQIRVDIDRDEPDWLEELTAALDQIITFRERMIQAMQAAGVPAG